MFEQNTVNEKMVRIFDDALVREREKQAPRNYLGASRLGEECSRRLYYEYTKTPCEGFSGNTYRIFDFGHDAEIRVADNFRFAGFDLQTEKPDGHQFGFGTAWIDGVARISGHIDGALLSGPVDLPYPLLWENKALGDKSFKDVIKKGVRFSKPIYYVQMMTYCAYMDLPNGALFTAINRDTGAMLFELVPFDAATAQKASDKGVQVISAKQASELPRVANDSTDFRCKWCPYSEKCWSEASTPFLALGAGSTPQASAPLWLTKK